MSFKVFLEKLQEFLDTGNLDIPGKECQVSDNLQRLVKACYLFERESYKRLGDVPASSYSTFCKIFITHLTRIPYEEYEQKVVSLDFRSKDLLLRGIEYSVKEFSSLDLSPYSKFL